MAENPKPHVLVLPFPAQGHVKPMLAFSQLLCHAGIHVTFVSTDHNHRRLTADRRSLAARFPALMHFAAVPDGLPADHVRTEKEMVVGLMAAYESFSGAATSPLRALLGESSPPVTRVVADGLMSFAYDVAAEQGIPAVAFRTIPACALWAYSCAPLLVENGEIPFPDKNMDVMVNGIPGMEGILRRRDLPSIYRLPVDHFIFEFLVKQTQALSRASALILNTVDALEPVALTQLSTHFPSLYTIGPVHTLLQHRILSQHDAKPDDGSESVSSGSLWRENRDSMSWLDHQPSRSVLYVSFGSLVTVTCRELLEIHHGLVNGGTQYLWVLRSEMVTDGEIPDEIRTSERGFLADWVPQQEVLEHQAVGGFMSHSGWNSTLEAILAGVPMLCWPKSADQQVVSRWVSEVWKIGLDMKDMCCGETLGEMIKCLMKDQRDEFARLMEMVSHQALESLREGGSSYKSFEKFVDELKKN